MAAAPSVRVVKTLPFKNGLRVWSNRYHFTGGTPADDTHWHTLFDAVTTAERAALQANNTIIEALGYAAGSDVPVSQKTYSLAGTVTTVSGAMVQAGEVVALVRYSTAARSTKNHPIYCFNYYHGISTHYASADADTLDANTASALATYATAWVAGFSDGTLTCKRASPAGHTTTGMIVEGQVTHRDFPYTRSQ